MAMYSYNGHILPEIPVVDGHPYAYLFYLKPEYVQSYYGKTSMHFIHLSSEPYVPNSNGYFRNYTVGSSVTAYHSADGEDWVFDETYTIKTDGYFGKPKGEETVYCWCNTNLVNNDGSVYLAASEPVSTAFVLPDGTELPALPEGCFEKYPYGMISYVESTNGEAAYALSVAEGTYIFVPGSATGEGSDYVISLLPGYRHYRYVVAPTAASGWEQYAESTTQHSGHDFSREDGTIEIRWCNHDILTATAMNDDGTPEIGPDLYRKSDVNYRIYGGWLNSMGNQARRLGNVSGALKPGEMESVMKGVEVGEGTIIPDNAALYYISQQTSEFSFTSFAFESTATGGTT